MDDRQTEMTDLHHPRTAGEAVRRDKALVDEISAILDQAHADLGEEFADAEYTGERIDLQDNETMVPTYLLERILSALQPAAQDGAEVERLRGLVDEMVAANDANAQVIYHSIKQGADWVARATSAEAERDALKADNERLRARIASQTQRGDEFLEAYVSAKEALGERNIADQALVDRYRDPKSGKFDFPGDVAKIVRALDERDAENTALKAENKRLREALVAIDPAKPIDAEIQANALRAHEQRGA